MIDDLRRIARALAVPSPCLLGLALGGFAVLVVAGATHDRLLGDVACAVGVCLAGIGARAVVRPSVPFDVASLNQASGMEYINSSRRLGGFYVLAGAIWAALALLAARGGSGPG